MKRLIGRRLLLAVPMVLFVTMLTFLLVRLIPGNPAYDILGPDASPAAVRAEDIQLHLNEPVLVQYWHWLDAALHGNLGVSLYTHGAVSPLLNSALGVSLSLIIASVCLATLVGIGLGTLSALFPRRLGRFTDVLAMLGFSIPNFLLGTYLVLFFAVRWHLFNATGFVPFHAAPIEWARSLVLPVIALSAAGTTFIAKFTRDAMSDVMSREYIEALRADGLPERSIIFRHGLRNAAIPIVTIIGLIFIGSLGGTALVESVFVMPGLGSALVQGVIEQDLPVIEGIALYFTIIVVVVNLGIDIIYGLLNPKARSL